MLLNAAGMFDFANKTVKLRKEVARVRLLQAERKEPETARRKCEAGQRRKLPAANRAREMRKTQNAIGREKDVKREVIWAELICV